MHRLLALFGLLASASVAPPPPPPPAPPVPTPPPFSEPAVVVREAFLMGTTLRAEVTASDRASAIAAVQQAFDTVARLEQVLSTWRDDSEIARLNHAAPGASVVLSTTLAGLLDEAARWTRATGGAFDPAVGALMDAWDLRGPGRVPAPAELARARALAGLAQFSFVSASGGGGSTRAVKRAEGAWLDTGAFGKGAGLRAAMVALRRAGAVSGSLNFGGQVSVFGAGPDRGGWLVPVAHPARRDLPVATLRVRDASVSTSAQSERFVNVAGRRLGHIVDPRSGQPVDDWGSVTVVAEDAAVADILSTALFVLGPRAGLEWAERHDVAALFLVRRGARLDLRATPALRPLLIARSPSSLGG